MLLVGRCGRVPAFVNGSHTRTKRFADAQKPVSASFPSESYYAVNPFRFTSHGGIGRPSRSQIHPLFAEEHLAAKDAATRPANFLFDELVERFKSGSGSVLHGPSPCRVWRSIVDVSQTWPEERSRVELSTLSITERVTDRDVQQRSFGFDSTRLVVGIEKRPMIR